MAADAARSTTLLTDEDYIALAEFRCELRRFHFFSEQEARQQGLTPKQHQALLSIRGTPEGRQTVGDLARRLLVKPNTASELAARLAEQGLLERQMGADGRVVLLELSARAEELLSSLSSAHLAELRRIKPLLKRLIDRIGG